MAIIVLLGTIGATMQVPTSRPSDASQLVAAAASAAQTDAVTTGNPSRVVVCIDPTAGALFLRYVAILTDVQTNPTLPPEWLFSAPGRSLPPGTFLWTDYSTITNTMTLDPHFSPTASMPGQSGTGGPMLFAYIEFDPTGQLAGTTSSGQVQNDAQWVFARGVVPTGSTNPQPVHVLDRDGFLVRKLGKISFFQSPDQIQLPTSP